MRVRSSIVDPRVKLSVLPPVFVASLRYVAWYFQFMIQ